MRTSKLSTGERCLTTCSSSEWPGEIPTTRPPASLAPWTAAYESPGHAPVIIVQPRSAMVRPSKVHRASTASSSVPLADPMTPIVNRLVMLTLHDGPVVLLIRPEPLGLSTAAPAAPFRNASGPFEELIPAPPLAEREGRADERRPLPQPLQSVVPERRAIVRSSRPLRVCWGGCRCLDCHRIKPPLGRTNT